MAQQGGPIERLSSRKIILDGKSHYEAYAYLKKDSPTKKPKYELYGNADGNGTDVNKERAVHIAISEALERLCYQRIRESNTLGYGLDLDISTSGMAAYPSFFNRKAKRNSYLEATERWSIRSLWESSTTASHYETNQSSINAVKINNPFNTKVILCWQHSAGGFAYGFAAGNTLNKAYSKAKIELNRNIKVLSASKGQLNPPHSTLEKRLLFFASPEGHDLFLTKISAQNGHSTSPRPKYAFFEEIKGEWTKYAKVWRCVFDQHFESTADVDYFFF
jgi:hypothetical protein